MGTYRSNFISGILWAFVGIVSYFQRPGTYGWAIFAACSAIHFILSFIQYKKHKRK